MSFITQYSCKRAFSCAWTTDYYCLLKHKKATSKTNDLIDKFRLNKIADTIIQL